MKKALPILFVMFLLTTFSLAGVKNGVFVKPPTLKMTLISSLNEIYIANVLVPEKWKSYYSGKDEARYNWLVSTYNQFTTEEKEKLEKVFSTVNTWRLLKAMTELSDDADINAIKSKLFFSFNIPMGVKGDLRALVEGFYEKCFKSYFEENREELAQRAVKLTTESDPLPNPFEYLETWTGMSLGDYECVFYFTFRSIGAWGFTSGGKKISTLQASVKELKDLYSTPLHEYAHNFFQQFTKERDFIDLSERLKTKQDFYEYWQTNENLKQSYNWRAFCEENLVEGFAKFLRYRLDADSKEQKGIYPLDEEFYHFLMEKDYTPQKYTLKEISFLFYEGVL